MVEIDAVSRLPKARVPTNVRRRSATDRFGSHAMLDSRVRYTTTTKRSSFVGVLRRRGSRSTTGTVQYLTRVKQVWIRWMENGTTCRKKNNDFMQEERCNHGQSKNGVPSVQRWMEKMLVTITARNTSKKQNKWMGQSRTGMCSMDLRSKAIRQRVFSRFLVLVYFFLYTLHGKSSHCLFLGAFTRGESFPCPTFVAHGEPVQRNHGTLRPF